MTFIIIASKWCIWWCENLYDWNSFVAAHSVREDLMSAKNCQPLAITVITRLSKGLPRVGGAVEG